MSIKTIVIVALAASTMLLLASAVPPGAVRSMHLDHAKMLLSEHMLIDGHNDWPYMLRLNFDNQLERVNLTEINNELYLLTATKNVTHTDINRLREGKVGGQFWAVRRKLTNEN